MTDRGRDEWIRTLDEIARDGKRSAEELLPLLYDELRLLARSRLARERPGQTLQATALVHEAYMRLVGKEDPGWNGRGHFFGAAARAMRNVLVDEARRKLGKKRGGDRHRVTLDEGSGGTTDLDVDLLALHQALEHLAERNERHARIVELRYFGGLSTTEISETVKVPQRSVERRLAAATGWVRQYMQRESPDR